MHAPGGAPHRERILATTRTALAAVGLLAIWLDPTEPTRFVALAYTLLVAYLAWSAVLVALLRHGRLAGPSAALAIHAVDLLWAAAVSAFTSGPSSPFFMFFVFALLAAAFRWGMRGALLSAIAAVVALLAQWMALVRPGGVLEGETETNRALIRSFYVLAMGYLLGVLGESENSLRAESEALVRILSRVRAAAGLRATVDGLFDELAALFDARAIATVVRDEERGTTRVFCRSAGALESAVVERDSPWDRSPEVSEEIAFRLRPDLAPDLSLPPLPDGHRPLVAGPLPAPVPAPVRHALGVWFRPLPALAPALLLIVDPRRAGTSELRLLLRVAREVAPVVESLELLRRVRSRAGALERARVARELHDGVLQGLTGLELEVGAMRRRGVGSPEVEETLRYVQQQLHAEALTVRELMDTMRPVDVRPGELLEYLTDVVDRFERSAGIRATLVADGQPMVLPIALCRELVKVVQEGLVNVRRHAAASHVVVRVGREGQDVAVAIDDDGRGFGFEGRHEHAELEATRRGPVVLRERVRSLGGSLAVVSTPGRGSRVEVRVPERPPST